MIGNVSTDNDHIRAFLQMEYTALRGELIKRVELWQRFLAITMDSAGAILADLAWNQYALLLLHSCPQSQRNFAAVVLDERQYGSNQGLIECRARGWR